MPSRDFRPGWFLSVARHWDVWRSAWREEKQRGDSLLPAGKEVKFLPAVLEIQQAPPSPIGRAILWTIMLLFAAAVLWACLGWIDIVAVARGRIVPGGYTKTIQPLESGIVTAIHVRDGQHVRKGEVLVELDPTVSGADRERVGNDYEAARVDVARLRALALGQESFAPPEGADPTYVALQQRLLQDQRREFQARIEAAERIIEQRQSAINAGRADILRLEQIIPIVTRRATSFRSLYEAGHGSRLEADEAERERIERVQELAGARQRLALEQAALAEARKNREAIASEFRKNIQAELAGIETRAQGLSKELVKATHTDQRQRLQAPVDGTVQQLSIHTVGGVVTPAQPLMVVVPDEDRLEVEAWVENKDIGFVDAGQTAEVKVDAFPFTKYGTVGGKVTNLSRDAVEIKDVGHVYAARVAMAKSTMRVENGKTVNLTPGMNVAVEIKTGERRVIEYFLSPILKMTGESGRER